MPHSSTPSSSPTSPSRLRTCVGCAAKAAPSDLVRVVLDLHAPEASETRASGDGEKGEKKEKSARRGAIVVDAAGGAFGRGAHVHPQKECIVKACRGGLSRAFKAEIKADPADVTRAIAEAFTRRFEGLIAGARGAGALAVGADVACDALERGASLVIVACDAESVVRRGPIAHAITEGRALAWGTKARLGELLGKDEVAVVAVSKSSMASEMKRVAHVADAALTSDLRPPSEAVASKSFRGVAWCPEVR